MFWIIVGVTLIVCTLSLPTIAVFPLEVLANLRPQLATLALLLAVASAGVGRFTAAAVLALAAALVISQAPQLFQRPDPKPAAPDLKVIWCNIFKDPSVADRLARLAAREQADVVVIGEPPRDFARLTAAMSDYSYSAGVIDPEKHGVVVFSRTPLSRTALSEPFLKDGYAVVSTTVTSVGRGLRIVGLHPTVARSAGRLRSRDAHILAAAVTAEADAPSLMVGDLNAAPWSTALRDIARLTRIRRLSTGSASTWFARVPVLGLPIDHALVSSELAAAARVGPGVGSDHLPLIVTITLDDR
jgi:endonuclease/exonuclease/phosphatase (EEP) superfamily protein YafD